MKIKGKKAAIMPARPSLGDILDVRDVKLIRMAKIFWAAVDHYYSLKEISEFMHLNIGTVHGDFDKFRKIIFQALYQRDNQNYIVFEVRDLENIRAHMRYFDDGTVSVVRGQFGVEAIVADFVELKAEKAAKRWEEELKAKRLAKRQAERLALRERPSRSGSAVDQ